MIMLYLVNFLLEIKMSNYNTLSLYYWLGFSIFYVRLYYYVLNSLVFSAYSLVNTKSVSKNISRRYLILNIN
uniref:Uncharacterized protein n=1 Tax=Gracilaria edulis TaxID=172966 RepID=A0A6C0A8V4_9FLOR|nr:hypothetical protein [Gracilaria edulis]QHS70607.1 hypothetical protein [Gracilaria edulis]UAD85674.1 hypothetical protein [Gracilaria edulis]